MWVVATIWDNVVLQHPNQTSWAMVIYDLSLLYGIPQTKEHRGILHKEKLTYVLKDHKIKKLTGLPFAYSLNIDHFNKKMLTFLQTEQVRNRGDAKTI